MPDEKERRIYIKPSEGMTDEEIRAWCQSLAEYLVALWRPEQDGD